MFSESQRFEETAIIPGAVWRIYFFVTTDQLIVDKCKFTVKSVPLKEITDKDVRQANGSL